MITTALALGIAAANLNGYKPLPELALSLGNYHGFGLHAGVSAVNRSEHSYTTSYSYPAAAPTPVPVPPPGCGKDKDDKKKGGKKDDAVSARATQTDTESDKIVPLALLGLDYSRGNWYASVGAVLGLNKTAYASVGYRFKTWGSK